MTGSGDITTLSFLTLKLTLLESLAKERVVIGERRVRTLGMHLSLFRIGLEASNFLMKRIEPGKRKAR
jgi:hypothetical protein